MMSLVILASLTANPATFSAVVARARPGDTITLATGRYPPLIIADRDFATPIRINGSAAEVGGIVLRRASGIHWSGGKISGPTTQPFGILMNGASRIRIFGVTVTGVGTGISVGNSTDIELIGNRLDGVRSDGINIGVVQRANIIGNHCMNFNPIQPTYDRAGKLLKDGDHSDCIQGWSRRGFPPTSDITITGNTAVGDMQGISFFDPRQGGYDRITIKDNDLVLGAWHGIAVYEGRGTVITGNRVRTIRSARARNAPFQPITAWIKTVGGTGERICGNIIEAIPRGFGSVPCK